MINYLFYKVNPATPDCLINVTHVNIEILKRPTYKKCMNFVYFAENNLAYYKNIC